MQTYIVNDMAMKPKFKNNAFAAIHASAAALQKVGAIVLGNTCRAGTSSLITRNFPEGVGTLEMLCIYEVAAGFIQKVSFEMGEKRLG